MKMQKNTLLNENISPNSETVLDRLTKEAIASNEKKPQKRKPSKLEYGSASDTCKEKVQDSD